MEQALHEHALLKWMDQDGVLEAMCDDASALPLSTCLDFPEVSAPLRDPSLPFDAEGRAAGAGRVGGFESFDADFVAFESDLEVPFDTLFDAGCAGEAFGLDALGS